MWCPVTPGEGEERRLALRGWPGQEAEGPGATQGHTRDGKTGLRNAFSHVASWE